MILVDEKLGLFLNIKTYYKNSSKLFDYSSKDYKEINTLIGGGAYLIRKDEKIIRVDNQSDIEYSKGEELLFYIRFTKNEVFSLENPLPFQNISLTEDNVNKINNKLWYILNSINGDINEDYSLVENDIIKIGNVKLFVKEINIKENEKNKIIYNRENKTRKYDIELLNQNGGSIFNLCPEPRNYYLSSEETKTNNIKCNICYNQECDIENPIINFCNCHKYFHFKCLKNELRKNLIIKENRKKTTKNYYIKGLNCKNCKYSYPIQFNIIKNEKVYDLIDIIKPKESYLILESIENKIYFGYIKFLFIIQLNEKEITLGRNKVNDIIISDPSISKCHAEIKYENGNIFIRDKYSKFGTLILVKQSIKINDNIIKLQIGRTVIEARRMKFGEFDKLNLINKRNNLPKKD